MIINKLATKTCELDPVSTSLLKAILPAVLPRITTIKNTSLKHGIFTNKWKKAIICPLLKKPGLDLILKNYRPVSNLSFLSKVLEQCILIRFNTHCNKYCLMPDYQSAYWANYSCETSLLRVTNDMLWAMKHKPVTAMIIMDLSAAFNTVDHSMLLQVLNKKFRIEGTP